MAAAVFSSGPVGTQTNPAAYTAAFEGMEVTTSLLEVFGLLPDHCGSHPLCFIGSFLLVFVWGVVDLLQQLRVEMSLRDLESEVAASSAASLWSVETLQLCCCFNRKENVFSGHESLSGH